MSTIDVKTRTKTPTDIPVSEGVVSVAVTPDGKTAFVANNLGGTVSTIDVKSRTKHSDDFPVGSFPTGVAITPEGKTAFVLDGLSGTVSTNPKSRWCCPADLWRRARST